MECYKSRCLICEESFPQKGLAFFKFPKDELRLKMWIKEISPLLDKINICPAGLKENGRICARHFKEKDFINFKKNSLVHNACPTIDVPELNKGCTGETDLNNGITEEHPFQKIEPELSNQDKDMFQCGRCKTQFQLLSEFIDHKRSQCKSSENALIKDITEKTELSNSPLPLETTYLISFENKLSDINSLEGDDKISENLVKIVGKDSDAANEVVSFVVNENGLLIGNPIPEFGGQVVVTQKSPSDQNPLLLANPDVAGPVQGLILTGTRADSKIVFTCPIQNDSGGTDAVVFSQGNANGEEMNVILTDCSKSEPIESFNHEPGDNLCEIDISANIGNQNLLGYVSGQLSNGDVAATEKTEKKEPGKTKTKLPCLYCGKMFEKPFNLQQHVRIHTGERPFQCIVCGRAFSQKSNVRKHMMRHRVWPQARQTLKIKADPNQQQPLSQELLDQMNYSCQYCSLSFKSYSLYKKHLTVHSNFKVYRCIQKGCDETFSDLDEFLSHSKIHSSSAEFQCHICLKTFTSLGELGAHQYDHDMTGRDKKEIEVKLKCQVCHAQFKTAESLKNHLAVDTHSYECVHCLSVFSSERFLRRHLATHLDPSQSKFKCPNCKKTFRTQKYLNNHLFVHLNMKPFHCEHCSKQFASKYRLKRHLAIHLNQYFECPFKVYLGCHKTFYRKDKLRDHMTTHSNCRIRSCQVCSKTFSTLAKLNQHMKKEHKAGKGKAVLKCPSCSQMFRKQKQLLQHHCTIGERKFRSSARSRASGERKTGAGPETVSNIEIIMVPYGSNYENGKIDENLSR